MPPKEVCRLATSRGMFSTVWTAQGLAELRFPVAGNISTKIPHLSSLTARQRALLEFLESYFEGHAVAWHMPLDFGNATAFQRGVWRAIARVPFGEVRSYTWLAEAVDHPAAVRAVANACGANPLPILIPCHRIVASGGGLGGFSAGLVWKRRLLQWEQQSLHHSFEPLKMDDEIQHAPWEER